MKCLLPLCLVFFSTISHAQDFEGPISLNGTRLYVSIKGKGEPLVILHGGPGLNHSYFKPHLKPLHQKFRIIYYDQRACGKSAVPSPDSISINMLVEDLEALRKFLDAEKINLLAHSWGAVLAVHYALAYPDNVKKVILSNPSMLSREFDALVAKISKKRTTKGDSIRKAELMRSGPMDIKKYEDFFLLSFKSSAYDPVNLERLSLKLQENFAEASKALFTGLMKDPAQSKNLYDELSRLKFPVLIISGKADIIPQASLEKLRSGLSHSRLITFEKSGHFPFIEETGRFNRVVEGFLNVE